MIVFRYLLKELVPQFLSTLIMISSIIIVSQLVRLSEVLIAFGLSVENILLPFLYIIMPFMTLIIPIAYLFAVMVSFARLSADGEYTALLAAGYSLKRALVPVVIVGAVLYGMGALSANYMEAWGRREFIQFLYRKTQTEMDNMIKFKLQEGVFFEDFLGFVLYAEKISEDRTEYTNVMLAPGDDNKEGGFVMVAPSARIAGSVEEGNLKMAFFDGRAVAASPTRSRSNILVFKRAEIDLLQVFRDQILGEGSKEDDYRSYGPVELMGYVKKLKDDPNRDEKKYTRARYLLHSRFANPFAAIGFAFFGMVFGIQDQRKGKSFGYVGTILTLICGYVVMTGFQNLAEKGFVNSIVAAWMPQAIIALLGGFLVYQKHRLPASEPLLAWRNLPFTAKLAKKNSKTPERQA